MERGSARYISQGKWAKQKKRNKKDNSKAPKKDTHDTNEKGERRTYLGKDRRKK